MTAALNAQWVDIILRSNFKGDETTLASAAKSAIPVPLAFGAVPDLVEAHGIPKAAALTLVNAFGLGVTHYEDEPEAAPARY